MPTLSEIQTQESGALNDLEKELIRQALRITGKAGTATYIDSNTRMVNTTPPQRQIIRALLIELTDISFDTTKAQSKDADYDPQRDKAAIVDEIRRILYPSAINGNPDDPNYPGFVPSGTLQFLGVDYRIGSDELS